MRALPIEEIRASFDAQLAPGARLVVSAPTGSGKSTQLPQWMADGLSSMVLVVEPRRVACRALAEFVAQGRGEAVGESVGYRVRFDDKSSAATRVLFVTPGMALSLLARRDAPSFGGVLIDEFHERSWECDLVTALAHRGDYGSDAAVVVCSATLEVEALTRTLDAQHLEGRGRAFEVTISHPPGERGGPSAADVDGRVRGAVEQALSERAGDVLVFLPGKREISDCARLLRPGPNVRVLPLHAGVGAAAMSAALRPSSSRRVFLATNVAETSLTLPSVTAVVDSGLVRRHVHRSGKVVLAVVPISHASAEQRRGRAGRVQDGRCYRLWSQAFTLEAATPPQVECVGLDDVLLRCGMCGVAPGAAAGLPWVTPLPSFAVESALERLRSRGAIDDDLALTQLGETQAQLPVSWLGARMLAGAPPALRGTLCDLVAAVEVGRDLLVHNPTEAQGHARADLFADARDEVDVALACMRTGEPRRHGLQDRSMAECRRLARTLRRSTGARQHEKAPSRRALAEHLLAAVPDAVFVRRARADRGRASNSEPWGNGLQEVAIYPYLVPGLAEQPPAPRAGVVLDREWIGMGQQARGVGRFVLGCELAWLRASTLGEREVSVPKVERVSGRKSVTALVRRTYAGVVLDDARTVLQGAALLEAVATLILRGSLMKGVANRLLDRLHAARVLAAWDATVPRAPQGEPHAVLRARLEAVGVATLEDLELVELDDLISDPVEAAMAAGMDPREATALPKDLPRRIDVPGGHYAVVVDVATRSVELTGVQGTKKEPSAGLLPRLRGFSVTFIKASRRVRVR